jgi:hypothetical protein
VDPVVGLAAGRSDEGPRLSTELDTEFYVYFGWRYADTAQISYDALSSRTYLGKAASKL